MSVIAPLLIHSCRERAFMELLILGEKRLKRGVVINKRVMPLHQSLSDQNKTTDCTLQHSPSLMSPIELCVGFEIQTGRLF